MTDWTYEKDSKFKIKTLFLRLLHHSYDNEKLIVKPITLNLNAQDAEKIELDHLIALKSHKLEQVFSSIALSKDEQSVYLNGLGNMMILTKSLNIAKSDKDLLDGLDNYAQSGLDQHFLFKEIEDFNQKIENPQTDATKAFSERKAKLIQHFLALIQLK